MNKKILIALAVIALGLLAYIGLVERHSLSSGELSGREARLLPRLVRARVEQITLDHADQHIVIRRVRTEAEELGEWRLLQPVEARADQEAVASLLGSLDWADARRRLGAVGSDESSQFGFDAPRARVELKVADETLTLTLGGAAATGDGVYARVGDGQAAVVGQDLLEALTADVGHFRDKALFSDLDLGELRGLSIERRAQADQPAETLRFEQDAGRFWIAGDRRQMAADGRVREAARALADLDAQRFIDGEATNTGLDQPSLRVRIALGAADDGQEGESTEQLLEVGGVCADHPTERYARADGGAVVCVAESDLTAFERPVEGYRQARVATLTIDDLGAVELQLGGRSLSLSRTDEGYHYTSGGGAEGDAERSVVSDWLSSLTHIAPLELVVVSRAELARYGLSGEGDELTLTGRGDAPSERIRFGSVTPDGQWIRRGEEDAVLRVSTEDAAKLALSSLDLRSRALIDERESSVAFISLLRAGVEERLERQDGQWQVTAPSALPADGARVSSLASKLAHPRALRFVSEGPRPEHGLAAPQLVIQARYEGAPASQDEPGSNAEGSGSGGGEAEQAPRRHTLKLGASTSEGVFAQLDDDPAVFLLSLEWAEETRQPYASRDLLRSTATQVRALELTTAAGAISLSYDGMAWRTPDGPADPDRTDALLEAVHGLRAVSIEAYLPAAAPIDGPELKLEITRVDDAQEPRHYVVDIAAPELGASPDAPRRARREDLAVELLVPAGPVQTLLDYRP
ncbi:MAG: DUF4340 domain-containing protein [Deltaproteobacteria bacterium]|nr:DUF4340 domain-containing protein [Deltaproteobacteria bacterium]